MKQMETTKKIIGDNTFYIRPFPAFKASYITGLIARTIGPLLGSLGGLTKSVGKDTDMDNIMDSDIEDMFPILGDALAKIDPDQMENLIDKLITAYGNVSVNGEVTGNKTQILDTDLANEIFCGELLDMLKLCWEVCKVNFSGFFRNLNIQSGSLKGYMERMKAITNGEGSTQAHSASSK